MIKKEIINKLLVLFFAIFLGDRSLWAQETTPAAPIAPMAESIEKSPIADQISQEIQNHEQAAQAIAPVTEKKDVSFLDRFVDDEPEEAGEVEEAASVAADQVSTPQEPIPPVTESPVAVVETKTELEAQKKSAGVEDATRRFLEPWLFGDPHELIEIEFDNAELSNLINYFEKKYQLTFILDDMIKPLQPGGKSVLGTKISFKTHKPLSKKQAWEIFVAFLDIAGLAPQPGPAPAVFRIASSDPKSNLSVYKGPLPIYIGVEPSLIPDNDTRIRYVYFVENTSVNVIQRIVDSMKSPTSPNVVVFPELRAVIMTDRANNVKSMLSIIKELDKVSMPEVLSVIKLKRTDATKVATLYQSLLRDETQAGLQARLLGGRKPPTSSYFSEGTRVIPEPRTNTLILLGTADSVKKIEDFLIKEIDRELDIPFSPLHIYTLKYVDAEAVAGILKEAVMFQPESEAAKYGGVRDGNKYFKSVSITAEKSGNRLVISADYEDYLKIYDTLKKIDIEQPQVAVKMIIMNVDVTNQRDFGVQIRNKVPSFDGLLGNQVNYQTSGLAGSPIIENPSPDAGAGAIRLLGNLVQVVSSIVTPGSTVLTFGSDQYGVWGLLRVLETLTKVSVIANPFLVTTHKYPANVKLGTIRRVLTGTTQTNQGPQDSFADLEAKLEVSVIPQVSYEGLITLDVSVVVEQFTQAGANSGDRTHKEIKTSLILENNAVGALGGLMRDTIQESTTKIPILGDIPIVGWFFKNKTKTLLSESLLVLISAEIIPPHTEEFVDRFTESKINDAVAQMNAYRTSTVYKDPINRWFFKDNIESDVELLNQFTDIKNRYIDPAERARIEKEHELQRRVSIERLNKRMQHPGAMAAPQEVALGGAAA